MAKSALVVQQGASHADRKLIQRMCAYWKSAYAESNDASGVQSSLSLGSQHPQHRTKAKSGIEPCNGWLQTDLQVSLHRDHTPCEHLDSKTLIDDEG